jgi:hypothetical protein
MYSSQTLCLLKCYTCEIRLIELISTVICRIKRISCNDFMHDLVFLRYH